MLPLQYATTINIGVLDSQYLILWLMLKHSGMANTKIKYSVAAVLYLQYVLQVMFLPMLNALSFYVSTFWILWNVHNMAVFCNSLILCFPCMFLRYFVNYFEIVPVAPTVSGIAFIFTFHTCWISTMRSLCFRTFSASFLITFLSPEIVTYINLHDPFSLSWIMMSSLLLGMVLSVYTSWFPNMFTLPLWIVSTDSDTCLYQCSWSNFIPISYTC